MYPVCPGSEGTLYPVCPGTMYPHCPPGDQSEARKSMTTNHSPPWGAVRVHCTGAAPVQCTLLPGAVRVHCTGGPRYNPGGARFDSPDCFCWTTTFTNRPAGRPSTPTERAAGKPVASFLPLPHEAAPTPPLPRLYSTLCGTSYTSEAWARTRRPRSWPK